MDSDMEEGSRICRRRFVTSVVLHRPKTDVGREKKNSYNRRANPLSKKQKVGHVKL